MKKVFIFIAMVMVSMASMAQSVNVTKAQSIGELYHNGQKVVETKTSKEKIEEYRRKAIAGDAEAQFYLADSYEYGLGVKVDRYEAARWYRKSAEQGYAFAQQAFGLCYFKGYGVPESKDNCVYWLKKSMENGLEAPTDEMFEGFGDYSDLTMLIGVLTY